MVDRTSIYMTIAYIIAMQSKDERTHIGAVIVGTDNEIRSTGYNGFPRGCNDHIKERQEIPEKYFWFEHAERNAIYNSARMGLTTKGCTMYTLGTPCADCARAIIQAGITKVVIHESWEKNSTEKWKKSSLKSVAMFSEAGVKFVSWDGKILMPEAKRSGKCKKLYDAVTIKYH
jgi:dCMP deaminase